MGGEVIPSPLGIAGIAVAIATGLAWGVAIFLKHRFEQKKQREEDAIPPDARLLGRFLDEMARQNESARQMAANQFELHKERLEFDRQTLDELRSLVMAVGSVKRKIEAGLGAAGKAYQENSAGQSAIQAGLNEVLRRLPPGAPAHA